GRWSAGDRTDHPLAGRSADRHHGAPLLAVGAGRRDRTGDQRAAQRHDPHGGLVGSGDYRVRAGGAGQDHRAGGPGRVRCPAAAPPGDRLRFRHLAATEGLVMAVVIGASIALGRTAPPVPQEIPAVGDLRVLSLVGYLPPEQEFGPATMFTLFQPDWVA